MSDLRELATQAKAWPFQEARRVQKRVQGKTPEKGYVLFETGYGPSGLPHIGTFGEVLRTTMVRQAFQALSDVPTRLFAFSDDMDGLRKVPENVPNQALLQAHLNKPLTEVPDPFGTHESFGHHNNARLRAFLDDFGFEYDFVSSTECYTEGRFDAALLRLLECYDAVMEIMLPTLGEERRRSYSPFLPVCPETRHVLQVPVVETNPEAGTIVYQRDDGKRVETPFIDPTLNGPLVAYLCSDEGNWITGQVFGSGGDRVVIMRHPTYDTGMFKPGGWDVEDLREHMPKFFRNNLEPVGLFKKPYPYYDGVKPS